MRRAIAGMLLVLALGQVAWAVDLYVSSATGSDYNAGSTSAAPTVTTQTITSCSSTRATGAAGIFTGASVGEWATCWQDGSTTYGKLFGQITNIAADKSYVDVTKWYGSRSASENRVIVGGPRATIDRAYYLAKLVSADSVVTISIAGSGSVAAPTVYKETTATDGRYFDVAGAHVNKVTIQSTSGTLDVLITGLDTNANGYAMANNGAVANLEVKNLVVRASPYNGTTGSALVARMNTGAIGSLAAPILFTNVSFDPSTDTRHGNGSIDVVSGNNSCWWTFVNCYFSRWVDLSPGNGAGVLKTIMTNCSLDPNSADTPSILQGIHTNGNASNCYLYLTGGVFRGPIYFGEDEVSSAYLQCSGGYAKGATIINDSNQNGVVVGCQTDGETIEIANCLVLSRREAIGFRSGSGHVNCHDNTFLSGQVSGLTLGTVTFYGTHDIAFTDNVVYAMSGTCFGYRLTTEKTGVACAAALGQPGNVWPLILNDHLTITGNQVIARGSTSAGISGAWNWAVAADGGDNSVQTSLYELLGTGDYGTVGATTHITTLAGLKTAWAANGMTGSDSLSKSYTGIAAIGRVRRMMIDGIGGRP